MLHTTGHPGEGDIKAPLTERHGRIVAPHHRSDRAAVSACSTRSAILRLSCGLTEAAMVSVRPLQCSRRRLA